METAVNHKKEHSSRRDFLKGMTTYPRLAMLGVNVQPAEPPVVSAPFQTASRSVAGTKKLVAIQIGGRLFVDEGVDKVLDVRSEKGGVNVLMPTVFTYDRGLAERQIPGQPLPDHGVQEHDEMCGVSC
jgi:hypothetical protein